MLEEGLLGLVARQREGLLALAKFKQKFSTNGVEEMIALQITRMRAWRISPLFIPSLQAQTTHCRRGL